jgi:hypothetical protein
VTPSGDTSRAGDGGGSGNVVRRFGSPKDGGGLGWVVPRVKATMV